MKSIAVALILVAAPALAAPPVAPIPPQTYQVALTPAEMQVIARAMNIAAGQCASVQDGCKIGEVQTAVIAKMNAALQAGAKGK